MFKTRKWICAFAAILLICFFPPASFAEDPNLLLGEDSALRIPVGATDALTHVILRVENLTPEAAAKTDVPRLKDQGAVGSVLETEVDFSDPVAVGAGSSSRAWLWTARVRGLPANSSQSRYALLSFGDLEKSVPYTLTNLSPAVFTWSVAAPASSWFVWFGLFAHRATPVVVTTGDYPASGLRLAQASLQSGLGTSEVSLDDLELCTTPTGSSGQFGVSAHTSATFYIQLKHKTGQWIFQDGKYTGTVSLAVNERPDLQTVTLTMQASSPWARILGVAFVAIGLFLAWWISVWAQARLSRLEALKPVAILQETVDSLLGELKKIRNAVRADIQDVPDIIEKKLNGISAALTIQSLDDKGCLPRVPLNPLSPQDSSSKLQSLLAPLGAIVDGLMILVRDGMNRVLEDWKLPVSNEMKQAIFNALRAMDKAGDDVIDGAQGRKITDDLYQAYQSAKPQKLRMAVPGAAAQSHVTTHYVSWAISRIYFMGWIVWGALTLLIGATTLVLTNPSFGTWPDMVFCILWGFGIPTGLDRLQQLTPGSIASDIGVIFPKQAP